MRLPRWLPALAPTRRLALIAALVAPAWLLSRSTVGTVVAFDLALLIALLALGDAVAIPSELDVELSRELPPSVGIGDRVTGAYRLRLRTALGGVNGWLAAHLEASLFDALPAAVRRLGRPSTDALAFGRGPIVIPLDIEGRERGTHPLGQVALRVTGPLRLMTRTLRFTPDDAISVIPSIAGVRRYRLLALQHRLTDVGVRAIRRRGDGTTFANLREYVHGDDPRHIDWKASARREKLITREFTIEQGQTILIAIDAGRMMTQLAGDLPRFEYALSAATILADVAIRSDDRVGVIVFDDAVRAWVPPARGGAALQRIREALIPLQASMREPDYATAFRTIAARHRKRSLLVLFTDVIDPRGSQALIAHSARSAARHLPLVVALRNEQLETAAVPRAHSAAIGLYESAAAEELVLARTDALRRMRHAGVSVLDVPPQAMAAAVVNRYLEIKARASL